MGTPQNDLQTMAPKPVIWEVGGQDFEQTPANLDKLADIMDVIVEEVLASGKGELLSKLIDNATDADADTDTAAGAVDAAKKVASGMDQEMLVGFVRILATLPRAMPRISATILSADLDHFKEHLRMRTAVGVLRTFVEQNDVGAIIQDFFGLYNDLKGVMPTTEEEPSSSA